MSDTAAPTSAAPTTAPSSPPAATPAASVTATAPSAKTTTTATTAPQSKYADASTTETAAQTEARKEAERRRYRLKVDGQEREEDLSDDEVAVRLQKGLAAEKRMAEAAKVRKEAEALREAIRSGKLDALSEDERKTLRKTIEDQIIAEFQEQQLPETERKVLEAQRKAEEYEKKLKSYEEAQERQAQEQLERQVFEQTEKEFAEALEAEGVLKTRHTLYMMAEIASMNLDQGIELSPKQMAAEVNRRLAETNRHVLTSLKGDQLERYLGEAVVKEILRHSIEKHRKGQTQPPAESPKPTALTADDVDDAPGAVRRGKSMREYSTWRQFKRG